MFSTQTNQSIEFLVNFVGFRFSVRLFAAILLSSFLDLIGIAIIFPYLQLVTDAVSLQFIFNLWPKALAYDRLQILIGLGIGLTALYLAKSLCQAILLRYQNKQLSAMVSAFSDDTVDKLLYARYDIFLKINGPDIGASVFTSPFHASLAFRAILQMANELIFVLLLFATFLIVSPLVTLSVLVILIAVGVLLYFKVIRNTARLGILQADAEKARYRLLFSMVNTIRDIKVMGLAELFKSYNHDVTAAVEDVSWRYNYNNALPLMTIEVTVLVGVVLTVMLIIFLKINIAQALPLIGVIGVATARLVPAAAKFFTALNSFRFYREAVLRFMNTRNLLTEAHHEKISDQLVFESKITLSRIKFSYGDKLVLNDINLTLQRGKSYGVVGPSGSGKSTLLDVITGLQSSSSGEFMCDGVPFDPFYSSTLSTLIGYVPQNITLLDESIAFNIAYSNDYDVQLMEHAIRSANLTDMIANLPSGLETLVGENGSRFSGGQRQRIGIARAFYRQPTILILDEATSALDSITEKEIAKELNALKGEITLLIVSHRISAVEDCDEIFVMNLGQIVDQGSHNDLLNSSVLYKDLFLAQFNPT